MTGNLVASAIPLPIFLCYLSSLLKPIQTQITLDASKHEICRQVQANHRLTVAPSVHQATLLVYLGIRALPSSPPPLLALLDILKSQQPPFSTLLWASIKARVGR
ncbi:hypothetical protein B0H14DRAFT_2936144 [Mycena olivaceomarginata]|nr:hypothetical protein B0H14DRAFT_2936144 [Mycena olivaceomarginata]